MKIFISWICIISLLSFKGLGADINTDSKTNNPNSESKSTSSNTNESKSQNNVSAPAGGKGSSSNSKGNTPATNSNQGNKSSQNNKGGKDTLAAESGKNANSSNKQSETKNGQTSKSENNKKSELSNNSADSNKSVKEEGFYFNMGGGNHQVGDHIRTYDGSSFVVREITDGNLFFGEFDRSVDLGKAGSIENKFVDPKNGKNNGLLEGEPGNDSGLAKNEGVGGGRAGPAPQTKALSDKQVEDVFHRAGNSQAPDSNDWAMLDAAAFNSELAHFQNYFNELKVENLAALDKSIQEMKTSQIASLNSNNLNLQSYSGSSAPGPLNIQNPLQEQVVSPFVDPDPNATVPYQSAYRAELEDIRNQIIAHTPVSPQQMTGRKVGLAALKTADDHYLVNDKVGGDYFKGIGLVAVDLVSDLNPITSIGKDLYRVFEGRDPLTGESLSGLEQGLAGFFFVTGVISFGGTNEIKAVGKWGYKGIKSAIEIFKENTNISRLFNDTLKMFKGLGKTEREIEIIEQGVKDAGSVIESAAKLGAKTGEVLQDFVKTSKQILGNEIGAVGKIETITDSLKSGKGVLAKSGTLIEREVLNPEQVKNLSRFEKNLPVGAKPTEIRELGDKGKVFSAEVPGQVPGSKAVYEKHIDGAGNTVNYFKTTYDPKGEIVHIKDKINGGIVEIGDLE